MIKTGLTLQLDNLVATLHPDGALELLRDEAAAEFSPDEVLALFRLFRQTPGVASIITRAYQARCEVAYEKAHEGGI